MKKIFLKNSHLTLLCFSFTRDFTKPHYLLTNEKLRKTKIQKENIQKPALHLAIIPAIFPKSNPFTLPSSFKSACESFVEYFDRRILTSLPFI